ncbi:MAG: N-acetylmuramoyl-L-alanine amidase family protein [Gemmatimonadaceae bacterium]
MVRPSRLLLIPVAVIATACASGAPHTAPSPVPTPPSGVSRTFARAPVPTANPKLPPVPEVDGPLQIKVAYPPEGALISSRDSNFVFGSVGNGTAGLTINGDLVPVWPNGAFMGWVPNPPVPTQWYDLVAYTATDTARVRYAVRTRAAIPPRAPVQPQVTTVSPAAAAVLVSDPAANVASNAVSDTDNVVIGRPTPAGTYRWFLFPGTPVRVTEYRDDMARVELDAAQQVWVARSNVKVVPGSAPAAPLRLSQPTLSATPGELNLELHVAEPPAYLVDEGERTITLTLYNIAQGADSVSSMSDPLLSGITQSRSGSGVTYRFDLTRPVYGYLVTYRDGVLKFSIRRPPTVDVTAPLRGMIIVVDPGHPPIGATGPTGLWEPVPTLAVGLRVRDLLEQKGAHVVMTRTTADPVALGDRPIIARRADANALVSIHLNADADGNNPFRSNGTGTYYFHPQSKLLATDIQHTLVPELGLRDRGVIFQNLALARPTWFPAVLAEGLFIIMPDQEAAIRTPQYQEAYAVGIVNGVERFFSGFAQ